MNLHRNAAVVCLVLAVAIGTALAGDSGTLTVRVQEQKGNAAMIGVTVAVENPKALSAAQGKLTDATGTATFLLPAGSGYKITVSFPGYGTQVAEDLKVELNKTKIVFFTLLEQLVEKVVVKGKAQVVDLEEGGENKVTFSDQFVEDLPVLGRSYQNVLTLAPGVNDANNDGNPNVHGARERDFKATVDGVSNVDPLTGTFMSNLNPDAIEEIEVVTTGAGAEFGRAVGGYGKIITKQGSNSFDGTLNLFLRSSQLDRLKNSLGERIEYHDVRPSLFFSGPVIKDKLFFVLSHEYTDRGQPQDLVGGGSIVITDKGSTNLDKLTWQATTRDKMILQWQADPRTIGPLGINSLTSPDSGYDYRQGGPTYLLRWNSQVSSVFNLESLVGSSHTGISLIPVSNGVKNECGVDELATIGARYDPFGRPGEPIDEDYCLSTLTAQRTGSYFNTYADDRIRYTLQSDATYNLDNFLGWNHTLKGGIVVEKERFRATDYLRSFSIFTEARQKVGPAGDATETAGGILTRTNFYPGLPAANSNRGDGTTYGVYFEDQFRPHSNVSLRVGVRVEQENISAAGYKHFDPQSERADFDEAYTACVGDSNNSQVRDRCARANFRAFHTYEKFPTAGASPIKNIVKDPTVGVQVREPETFRLRNTNVGPRFSISWDPNGDQKTKLFGTAGRIYDKTFLAIPIAEQGPDNFVFTYEVIPEDLCRTDPNGNGTVCTKVAKIEPDAGAIVAPATINQVDRNLRTPYVDEYTAGFSREIAQETSVTLTYIRRRYRDQFQDVDVNHYARDLGTVRTSGCSVGQDGALRPNDPRRDGLFDDCGGKLVSLPGDPPFYRPRLLQLPDGIPDLFIYSPFFNAVYRIGNYNKTDYTAIQLELVKRQHRNWQLEASYVWSKATGNAEDYNSPLGDDPSTVQDEFGYLDYDQRHFVKVNVTTQIPVWNVRVGSSFNWASGQPYSIYEQGTSIDQPSVFGNFSVAYSQARTTFPTGQRNDQRNEGFWNFNLNAKKDFTIGKTNLETSLEVFNLLNSDNLFVAGVINGRAVAFRSIGRRFQIGLRYTF